MDKLRADFEDSWVEDNSSTPEEADIRREALKKIWHINENGEGVYFDSFVMLAWKWWQASRASIVVESITPSDAPSGLIYQIGGAGLSHDEAICEGYSAGFNEAIRSIGLSIKGE